MPDTDKVIVDGSGTASDPDPAAAKLALAGASDPGHAHEINQRIFETSLDLILVVDRRGNFIRVSPSANAILGFDPDEMVGRSAAEFLFPEDLQRTRDEMRRARYGESTRNFECRYVHKSGEVVPLSWTGVWSEPAQQYFFIGRDITQILAGARLAEQTRELDRRVQERTVELGRTNRLLNAIIEAAPLSIFMLDPAGNVVLWTASAERLFGYTADEAMGAPPPYLDNDELVVWRTAFARTVATASSGFNETHRTRRDGTRIDVSVTWAPVHDEDGTLLGIMYAIADVTDRRRLENQLRQSQKMEAIGNLTGGLAHDFNNMLGVILGNLDLAGELLGENREAAELVREANEAAATSAELTRRLLAFARQQPLRPERIALSELVSDVVRLLRRTLGENIEIALDLADDVWPVVADPVQLESALTNLATNARDAMPKGGKLLITTGNRRLDADYVAAHVEVTQGDYAAIEITDTGTGMPPEIAEHIFEPFFTTKEQGRGTGLGLSMVFGFIKQSGGHINVYSEPGVGTTFRLYLPRAAAGTAAVDASPTAASPEGAGETVLAVEDNPRLRRLVIRQLSQLGYRPLEADGPAAALAILENEKVDVLFTDIVMPGPIDGIALADQAVRRWPGLKVVFTSGFPGANIDDQLGPRASGARLLSKPYRKEELASLLSEMLY